MSDIIPENAPLKQCPQCSNEYPATSAYFRADRRYTSNLNPLCNICSNIGDKRCSSCANWYPRSTVYFNRDKGRKDGLCHHCKECSKKKAAAHYKEHPEYYKQYDRDNAEQVNMHYRKYRETHPEVYVRYRIATREQHRVHECNRRALKKRAGGTFTKQDIQAQYDRQKGKCYYCHKKITKYHIDHVVPLSRGGSNGPENLVIACPACNLKKNDKLLHEWFDGGRLL